MPWVEFLLANIATSGIQLLGYLNMGLLLCLHLLRLCCSSFVKGNHLQELRKLTVQGFMVILVMPCITLSVQDAYLGLSYFVNMYHDYHHRKDDK